jgi:pyruvate dehydrogenase complex dehydrogenase (E1) component
MAKGLRFGLDGFGASAPAGDLYDHFGLTVDKIVPQVLERLAELGSPDGSAGAPMSDRSASLAEAEAHPS